MILVNNLHTRLTEIYPNILAVGSEEEEGFLFNAVPTALLLVVFCVLRINQMSRDSLVSLYNKFLFYLSVLRVAQYSRDHQRDILWFFHFL